MATPTSFGSARMAYGRLRCTMANDAPFFSGALFFREAPPTRRLEL